MVRPVTGSVLSQSTTGLDLSSEGQRNNTEQCSSLIVTHCCVVIRSECSDWKSWTTSLAVLVAFAVGVSLVPPGVSTLHEVVTENGLTAPCFEVVR